MRGAATGRGSGERGTASIEVVGLVPLLVLLALLVLQLGVAGWTASQTQEAARQAARAQSLGGDARTAAEDALPGALEVEDLSSDGEEVRLRVRIPVVSVLPGFTVEREATMPGSPS